MITNDNKNYLKKTQIYECKLCNYICSDLSNFKKHLQTKKHSSMTMITNDNKNYQNKKTIEKPWVCICGRAYKYRSGLSRHKNMCKMSCVSIETNLTATHSDDIRTTLNKVVEENRELRSLIIEQQKQFCEKTTHNTYNLQVFLTEGCKDAINMSDFIASLPIQMQDLEHTRKHGLYQGIANIMLNGLKQLGATKRPIHCTNVSKETLYIKDNDTWAEGNDSTQKLKESLKTLALKQRKAVKEWEELNPDWEKSETKMQEWMLLVKNVMSGFEEDSVGEGKLMREIAKETELPNKNILINV